eukprot:TRINITY_DN1638_c0_g1_i16.p1 TRINITY_DN1638_c0_g1~~TRINITY_DN1638_c0_g1_i16.p1  ORF type:complete len:829 (-),score=200.10 TRINITY_DN1638_c0_g1_i16:1593-4055(-)
MVSFDNVFRAFYRVRLVVIAVWVLAALCSAYFALQFMSATTIMFYPPKNSEAAKGNTAEQTYYGDQAVAGMLVLYLSSNTNSSILCDWTARTSRLINDTAMGYDKHKGLVVDVQGYYLLGNHTGDPVILLAMKEVFVSPSGHATLLFIEMTAILTPPAFDFITYMRDQSSKWDDEGGNFSIGVTGYNAMLFDIQEGSTQDMERMDLFALPLALLVLMLVLRAWPLMLIPCINVGITILVSFAIMYPIALLWDVATFTLAMMMSVIIAMSIDYSLFLLSRYREEVELGNKNYTAVKKMLLHAGGIVLTSGGVLTVCLLGIAVFPVSLMASMGVAAALSLLCTILVNLSFTPAMLLTFGKFFSIFGFIPCVKKCRRKPVKTSDERIHEDTHSFWHRSASFSSTTKWSIIIIIAVLLFCAPFGVMLMYFEWSLDNMQVIPSSSPAAEILNDLSTEFPMGKIYPYQVLAIACGGRPLLSPEYFDTIHSMLYEIGENVQGFHVDNFVSITNIGSYNVSSIAALTLLGFDEPVYTTLFKQLTNSDRRATHIMLAPDFNPASRVQESCTAIRKILKKYEGNDWTFYLRNQMVDENDAVEASVFMFPFMILITFAVIMFVLLIAFRSAVLPLRTLSTITITLLWIYGFGSMIFCTDWFNWLTKHMGDYPGFYWMTPIMCFSIIVGLGLDYDIFLFSRIMEYRKLGYSAKAAIIKGVVRTGYIITFAGCIMAIAFGGLMSSSLKSLKESGFLLCFSVLLDTFVIRTLLNPAILALCGDASYWPVRMETKYHDTAMLVPEETMEYEAEDSTVQAIDRGARGFDMFNEGRH